MLDGPSKEEYMKNYDWDPSVEEYLKKKFSSEISYEKSVDIYLEEYDLKIESSWYDRLVRERKNTISENNSAETHLIEIKSSEKGQIGSFGAFTIGEWITAYLSIHKYVNYVFHIIYVTRKSNNSEYEIMELDLSEELLEDLFSAPQLKLYFRAPFIRKHLSKKIPSGAEHKMDRTRNNFLGGIYKQFYNDLVKQLTQRTKGGKGD